MNVNEMTVEVIRKPEQADWERCKVLALNTISKKYHGSEITEEWKHKMLTCKHSPIRTLMFTIRMEIPYCYAMHFRTHKFGVEHFISSQRNDRQDKYDREGARQDAPVSHIMDINAAELMSMANNRLCRTADPNTRYIMSRIVAEVEKVSPEFKGHLFPKCAYLKECPEVFGGCKEQEKELQGIFEYEGYRDALRHARIVSEGSNVEGRSLFQ